ncbi:hypothetical protein O181_062755 [Austropuccinia psidii MF-1]|uniref:Uncharacterized protein n=1 Tax=Austropuccinia psidii MF-1 TaxID=1389203 RepID=A0A9Q3EPY0_9BASI|nr:hypothetical protein [Austropuccinia psidii MF-1]
METIGVIDAPALVLLILVPDSNLENRRSSLDHDQPNPPPSLHSETRPQLSPTQIIPSPNFHQSFPTIENSNEPFKDFLETNFYFPSSGLNCQMHSPSVSFLPSLITLPNPTRPGSISSQDINVIDYLRRPHCHSIALNSIHPNFLGAIKFREIVNSLTQESSYNPNPISADSTPSGSHSPSQARL